MQKRWKDWLVFAAAVIAAVAWVWAVFRPAPAEVPDFPLVPLEELAYEHIDGGIRITAYGGSGQDIVIPDRIEGEPVIAIGEGAFQGSALRRVYIPQDVEVLEREAFADCLFLEEVHLPRGLARIESRAFANCISLLEIKIPPGLDELVWDAFARDAEE